VKTRISSFGLAYWVVGLWMLLLITETRTIDLGLACVKLLS